MSKSNYNRFKTLEECKKYYEGTLEPLIGKVKKDFTGVRHKKLKFLDLAGKVKGLKSTRVMHYCLCDCGNYFLIRKPSDNELRVLNSCGCDNVKFLKTVSTANNSKTVETINNLDFKVLKEGKRKDSYTWELQCQNGHKLYDINAHIFVYHPVCHYCEGKPYKISEEELIKHLEYQLSFKNLNLENITGDWETSLKVRRLTYRCLSCGLVNDRTVESQIVNDYGCTYCGKLRKNCLYGAWFYINKIVYQNSIFYKYGVTKRSPELRLKDIQQSFVGEIPLENVFKIKLDNQDINVFRLESYIKGKVKGSALSKDILSDGYTETVVEEDLEYLLKLVTEYLEGAPE